MCEFCVKHGEGKKWYLQAKNYSDDLLSDIRRREFVEEFFSHPEYLAKNTDRLNALDKAPGPARNFIARTITNKMKKAHFGQVLPIEDIEHILGFVNSVVRMACMCRHIARGVEKRYCYAFSLAPNGGMFAKIIRGLDTCYATGPDTAGLESLTTEETLAAFHSHEREGLCHTVWTFQTPFIGGVCNCDRTDCLAMRATVTHAVPVMFRAEYVAEVDPDLCTGCRECMRACQFGAITHSAADKKAVIDQKSCYGCGICRAVCRKNAIRLEDRIKVPAVADVW